MVHLWLFYINIFPGSLIKIRIIEIPSFFPIIRCIAIDYRPDASSMNRKCAVLIFYSTYVKDGWEQVDNARQMVIIHASLNSILPLNIKRRQGTSLPNGPFSSTVFKGPTPLSLSFFFIIHTSAAIGKIKSR